MAQIFPIDFDEKLTMAQDDYILFSDSEDWNKIKKAQYKNLKWEKGDPWTPWTPWQDWEDGAAATITVWSTTTGTPWSSASVTNSWTSSAAVLDFTIPQWAKWEPWEDGQDWADGAAATITVWTTTTLPAWSSATVTNVWTSQDAILNFWIPKGDSWSWSWDVNWPASSTDWDVAIFDWSTGKLIKDWSVSLATLSAWASAWATAVQPWDIGTAAACNTWTSSWNVPILDSNWKLATSTLPWVALTDTFTVSTSSDLTSLSSADQWDIAIVTSENKTYVLSQAPYSTASNWKQILSPTGSVTSVNGSTWAVTVSEFTPWWTATTGYVVTKTASGYEWSAPSGWSTTITVTLASANWSNNEITVTATWVTASNTVIVSPDPSSITDYTDAKIYCSAQGTDSLTFVCDTEPSNDIDVNIVILN